MLSTIAVLVWLSFWRVFSEVTFSINFDCSGEFDIASLECSTCSGNSSVSEDGFSCLTCDSSQNAVYSSSESECNCPTNWILNDFQTTKLCSQCPANYIVDTNNRYECTACELPKIIANDSCICPSNAYTTTLSGNGCVVTTYVNTVTSNYPVATTRELTYYDVHSSDGASSTTYDVTSAMIDHYFTDAAARCNSESDEQSCQSLGNLCVLAWYNSDANVCSMFSDISDAIAVSTHDFTDWKEGLPWLSVESASALIRSTQLSMKVELYASGALNSATTISTLEIILVKYSVNGSYLGYETLSDQLQLCDSSRVDQSRYLRFGNNFENACQFDLSQTIDYDNTVFYDAYLRDSDGSYFPIPVKILNYRDGGSTPNYRGGSETTSLSSLQLHRRFFLYDNIGSIEGNITGNASVIAYARSIEFRVEMIDGSSDRIYPPYFVIRYASRKVSDIATHPYASVSFKAVYTRDLTTFWVVMIVLFVVIFMGVIMTWIYRIYRHQSQSLNKNINILWFLRTVIIGLGISANGFFWLLMLCSAIAYLSFKGQRKVEFLLPTQSDTITTTFETLLIYAFFAKFFHVLLLIWDQINIDVFFIDWEKPKIGNSEPNSAQIKIMDAQQKQQSNATGQPNTQEFMAQYPQLLQQSQILGGGEKSVSAWRKLFIVNEWNELQSQRDISLPLTLFCVLIFLQSLKLEYLATMQPLSTDLSSTAAPMSIIYRFLIAMFFFVIVSIAQLLFRFLICDRFIANKGADFVDLVGLANISVFILDSRHHGWYIHGKTIHQYADVSMEEMNENIENERKNLCKSRGLLPERDTFEIFVSNEFRKQYDQIYSDVLHYAMLHSQRRVSSAVILQSQLTNQTLTSVESKADDQTMITSNEMIQSTQMLSMFLSDFIEKTSPHLWEDRQAMGLEKIFGPHPEMNQEKNSLFFDDISFRFASVFWFGKEYDLLIFNALLYAVMDLWFEDTFIAVLVTMGVDWFMGWLRSYFGEVNLSKKALVDQKFLV